MKKLLLFLIAITMGLFSFAQSQMSGTYTVGTGGSYDYSSMADAGMAIKAAEFTDDVTLLICTDLTENINTGIVNKSEYTLTIRPDKDENRTITYTTTKDNTGPTAVFVIGGDMTKTPGSTIGWASIQTKNVIVDGAAEGKTTPRLKITTAAWGTSFLLYGDVRDCVVKNCILENTAAATANYALTFRSENYSKTSKNIGPKNCLIDNCIIQSTHATKSQAIYFQANEANSYVGYPTNITIRNCNIKAYARGMYLRGVNGLNVEGCTFNLSDMASGLCCHGIFGNVVKGTINVKGNKFIKNSTKNIYGGEYGLQTITAKGNADVWVIENNYFAGYDALKAITNTTNGNEPILVAIRCEDPCVVRHNTFYMPKLTKSTTSQLVSSFPTALLWFAGSKKYIAQNNIFVCEETTSNVSLIRGNLNENVTGNVFYHQGGNAAIVAGDPSCMNFADLVSSYPALAATSKWTNVTFANAANGDLSLAGSSEGDLNLAVNRLSEVPTDINGKTRAEKTYAGAYEGGEFPAEVCTVTAIVAPIGGGTIVGAGEYVTSSIVTLTASENTGYDFVGWTGDVTSTDNPLTITVNRDMTITANFTKEQYTLTVLANDAAKGDVTGSGTYEYGTEVEITATAKPGYEFIGWSNGSKENSLTITMTEDTELTANFRAILASSITLNAHPVKDYSASIVGTMKRAIQNGENTIVLTHEANGTAHIYNIAHTTKTITEISQEGVVAVDPNNAGDLLAISDIALTDDDKLVACNYVVCQFDKDKVETGYKRGTSHIYIWNDLAGNPEEWLTSQKTGNYNVAYMGHTMALKGSSQNAEVTISAFNKSNSNTRYSHLYVVDGTYTDASYKYSRDNAALHPTTLGKSTYELNASPLAAGKWIVDGELVSPIEFVEKNAVAIDTYTALNTNVLGKKYNGASYLFHNDHHLMVAPYAADDKLAGVKILGITDGFANPAIVETNGTLANAIDATTAAATAYVDTDGDLTIYLIADGKVYTFSEKEYTAQTYIVTANAGTGGAVEGGGTYEEGSTATLTATPNNHYDFVNWTGDVESTDNPLVITSVNNDLTITANFQEHTKYTIIAVPNDENMGTVTGGDTYYVGETITLKATANSGYVFAGWDDGEKSATRTVEVSGDATYTANFQAIAPRAWAYDLKVVEDGDNYKFTFNATAAGSATLLFADIDGNPIAPTSYDAGSVVAGANAVLVAKTLFTDNKDVYWSVKMDGEAIPAISEITDQSRGIYDFYNMMGVVVDNDPNSDYFGKIYIQQSYEYPGSGNTAERNKTQKAGIFIYDQGLNELNPENEGYKPTMPDGYTAIGKSRESFKRLAINPTNGNLVFGNNVASEGSVWTIGRDNLTGEPTNIIAGVAGINQVNAICYDEHGTLYVLANITTGANAYKLYRFADGVQEELTIDGAAKIFVDSDVAMTSDGRGGLWIAQRRDGIQEAKILLHINIAEKKVDFAIEAGHDYSDWFAGKCYRAAVAYNTKENLLAVQGASKILLFKVSYDTSTGAPSISKYLQVSPVGSSIDGLAFDYAGDLYTVNSGSEKFQKFTLPTTDNICTVPAPSSQKLILGTQCEVTVTVNDPAMGSVEGAGQYEKGAEVTLTANPNEHHVFVNWTIGAEVLSEENPYSFIVQENITITANFTEQPKYTITVQANDATMGSVEGGGTVYVGESVEIKATPNPGHAFVKWDDGNTSATRTVVAEDNKTYTAIFQAMIPRAWAYDLRMVEDGDNYKFTFKATSAGNATLLFTNKAGTPVAPTSHSIGNVEAGEKSVNIAKSEFGGTEDIYWSVQMDGAAIENMVELTNDNNTDYHFWMPTGVAVDNNPESPYFGQFYIASPRSGKMTEGGGNGIQHNAGVYVFDQTLTLLNETKQQGYIPSNVSVSGSDHLQLHRIAVNPINNHVAFSQKTNSMAAIWNMDPADMEKAAVNLISETSIADANSLCFDKNGVLYVADASTQSIHKVIDGVATIFATTSELVQNRNAIAPDGRGGIWVAQYRGQDISEDDVARLMHFNAGGTLDYKVDKDTPHEFTGTAQRGAVAYNTKENILAFGANRVATLYQVTYDLETGVPTLGELCKSPDIATNIDGLAFDYAGDLYITSASVERLYKFVLPTNNNTCTVPAPASQVIKKEARYTVTVKAEPADMGTVSEGGEYKAGETITITATPNKGYQFVNWTYGSETSTNNPLELVVNSDITVTAHFQVEPLAIKGIVKRAVQIGESTVVLTHENDGTPHLYKVVNGELEAEISQVGVEPAVAGYLSISDIAATEDGKLVACNYVKCTFPTASGTTNFYKWNTLADNPTIWFTAQTTGNYSTANMGYSMAVKGTSSDAQVTITAFNVNTGTNDVRFTHHTIADGKYQYSLGVESKTNRATVGSTYELNASPLASANWIFDGENITPTEFVNNGVDRAAVTINASLDATLLGKKFNGATYFSMYGNHFMVAPYADTDGNLVGVRVLNITQGLNQATEATDESLDLTTPISATAAATAVKVNGEELTITLVADNQLYTLATTLDFTTYTRTVINGNFGTICLPYGSSYYTGAKFYEISWMKMRGTTPEGIYLDEVIEPLIAGKPYIFKATSNLLTVYANTDAVNDPILGEAGLTGTFEPISTDNTILEGNYMIAQNKFWLCGAGCSLSENRAYIDAEIISQHTTEKQEIPGRRRISMGAAGENGTTGLDNLTEDATIQPNAHGTYDVLGRQLKEPTVAGFYIINGQKVIITK